MRRVDATSRVYAVLGHPVGHSLSPRMQNAAFRAANRNAVYVAFDIPSERLADALRGLHAAGVEGLNVTTPHKEEAYRLATRRTAESDAACAANTLRREETGWAAHATDGIGFRAWVGEAGLEIGGKRVLLLGAGGAARSILPAIVSLGAAEIGVVSRGSARARELVAAVASRPPGVSIGAYPLERGAEGAGGPPNGTRPWDLLVRALAAPRPVVGEEVWWAALGAMAPVLDLNYGERAAETRSRAEREGRLFQDGLALLLHQGAASFEFWTGSPAPLQAMREALGAT